VLVEMRQDQRALAHLSAVHNPAEASFNMGQLLVDRNRAADAAPYFQAAIQQNPNMQQAQQALARLQGASVAAATVAPPTVLPQQAAPAGPSLGPQPQQQPAWSTGPQMSYPATARTPAVGASSYVAPQYLPPVANQPGGPAHR
jgi:Flp pilus assembly protein TadD